MRKRKPKEEALLSFCAEVGLEDGAEARIFLRKSTRGGVKNRKALQLCAQVARTLQCVLAGECADDLLRDLVVESVVPAPNSRRALVTVGLPCSRGTIDLGQVMDHLQRAAGKLRTEIASAIHRKKVPELTFRLTQHEVA